MTYSDRPTTPQRPTPAPGDAYIEPREQMTKGGDKLLTQSVLFVVVAGLLVGAALGLGAAMIYKIWDPLGVELPIAIAWGTIVGAVIGGMVSARQIVGRFDERPGRSAE